MTPPERPDLKGAAQVCGRYLAGYGSDPEKAMDEQLALAIAMDACTILDSAPDAETLRRLTDEVLEDHYACSEDEPMQELRAWVTSVRAFLEGSGTPPQGER